MRHDPWSPDYDGVEGNARQPPPCGNNASCGACGLCMTPTPLPIASKGGPAPAELPSASAPSTPSAIRRATVSGGERLAALLREGEREGVYPMACAEVWLEGECVFQGGTVPVETLFDVASLTKVMGTTALLLQLQNEKALSLESPVRDFVPEAAVAGTVADLLYHRAGLPAFQPFFAAALEAYPSLLAEDCAPPVRLAAATEVAAAVAAVRPRAQHNATAVYSDLGFILLGLVVERVLGTPLDEAFRLRVAEPLGLEAGYRRLSRRLALPRLLAPTGTERPRPPAPGQEGLWSLPSDFDLPGTVDDDNAFCLDGVAGHAGLFATASAVARFGQRILDEAAPGRGPLSPPTPWRPDDAVPGSTRALGFDTPSRTGSSSGRRIGRGGSRGAIGHTGFTGTSVWIDLDRRLVVALLSNRVALGRDNQRIRDFRPRFHEAVFDAVGLRESASTHRPLPFDELRGF